MINDVDEFKFSADRPIHTADEDLLGRAKFSESLAEAIINWNGKDSLVVALYGDWGAGKSSVKNMALTYMSNKASKPMIIEFSPWEWAAQEKITKAFFDEISKSIGKENTSDKFKKLASSFKKYGNYLSASEVILTSTSVSMPLILTAIAGIGFMNVILDYIQVDFDYSRIITLISTASVTLISLLSWLKNNTSRLSTYFNEKAKDSEKNLTEIRDELKADLNRLKEPILIVMDDLDRLSTTELRMIFQLIKANTDFPNITFLLLFQKNTVEEKLTDKTQSGKEYIEKIIQVPFNIPKIAQAQVHEVLFGRLNIILGLDGICNSNFDRERWTLLYHAGLKNYFNTLRSVYRYTSTLAFHFSLLKGRTVFEANSVDLIAIECLRVFEPEIYNELSMSKEVFTKIKAVGGNPREERESLKKTIDLIVSKAKASNKETIEKILKELFPTIQWIIDNHYYDYQDYNVWFSEGRICHGKNFENYFQLSLSENEITKSDLIDFISLTSDGNLMKRKILELNSKGMLKEFLSQFESYENKVLEDSALSYISTLIDVGDLVKDDETSLFDAFGTQSFIYRLIYSFLERIDEKLKRGEVLLECFKNSNGFVMIAKLILSDQGKRDKNNETLLEDYHYNLIKNQFIIKLKEFAFSNKEVLVKNNSLLFLLYRWREWGAQDLKEWMMGIIVNHQNLLHFLSKITQHSTSYDGGGSKRNYYIKVNSINDFSDIESVDLIVSGINESELSDYEKFTVELFKECMERFRNGESEEWL